MHTGQSKRRACSFCLGFISDRASSNLADRLKACVPLPGCFLSYEVSLCGLSEMPSEETTGDLRLPLPGVGVRERLCSLTEVQGTGEMPSDKLRSAGSGSSAGSGFRRWAVPKCVLSHRTPSRSRGVRGDLLRPCDGETKGD